jgi:predicted transcriptional regulator
MVFNFTIPEPGQDRRVKDMIIDILGFEWPLTLIQLYNKITKNYSCATSYQSVYKSINELCSEGVILKNDKLYSINLAWIEKLKDFSNHIESNYKNKDKIPLIEGILKAKTENNVTVLTFNSTLEMDKAWLNIKKDYYNNLKEPGEVTFWEGNHCWWLLIYPEAEYEEMDRLKFKKVKHFFINHSNSLLDKYAKKFYDNMNMPFKISNRKVESDIGVFGDTIMQVSLPLEIRDKIEEIYSKAKNPSEVNIHDFIKKVLTKETSISLILTKNKEIAEQLKQKVLREFN